MGLHPQLEPQLFDACKRGDVVKMRFLIDECEVSVNAVEEVEIDQSTDEVVTIIPSRTLGRSLLMVACEHRHVRAVNFLLARPDLNVNYTMADGRSALTVAQTNSEVSGLP